MKCRGGGGGRAGKEPNRAKDEDVVVLIIPFIPCRGLVLMEAAGDDGGWGGKDDDE